MLISGSWIQLREGWEGWFRKIKYLVSTYNRVYQSFLNLLKSRATTHYKDLKLYSVQCACTVWDYDNILLYHGVILFSYLFFWKLQTSLQTRLMCYWFAWEIITPSLPLPLRLISMLGFVWIKLEFSNHKFSAW